MVANDYYTLLIRPPYRQQSTLCFRVHEPCCNAFVLVSIDPWIHNFFLMLENNVHTFYKSLFD